MSDAKTKYIIRITGPGITPLFPNYVKYYTNFKLISTKSHKQARTFNSRSDCEKVIQDIKHIFKHPYVYDCIEKF